MGLTESSFMNEINGRIESGHAAIGAVFVWWPPDWQETQTKINTGARK
jgi:hypothetical protein